MQHTVSEKTTSVPQPRGSIPRPLNTGSNRGGTPETLEDLKLHFSDLKRRYCEVHDREIDRAKKWYTTHPDIMVKFRRHYSKKYITGSVFLVDFKRAVDYWKGGGTRDPGLFKVLRTLLNELRKEIGRARYKRIMGRKK